MANQNFTLKNPMKIYIWSVKSYRNPRMIMKTSKLSPKDFHFQVGQFVQSSISEMKLIGYKYIKDHFGNDVEETFENTNKVMKQSILDQHNEHYSN
jgi:hypothetical protein|tara:strand:+ start:462 stop:749 length:288 start_codon:yes stop_codon:yes gene_type:complete